MPSTVLGTGRHGLWVHGALIAVGETDSNEATDRKRTLLPNCDDCHQELPSHDAVKDGHIPVGNSDPERQGELLQVTQPGSDRTGILCVCQRGTWSEVGPESGSEQLSL